MNFKERKWQTEARIKCLKWFLEDTDHSLEYRINFLLMLLPHRVKQTQLQYSQDFI